MNLIADTTSSYLMSPLGSGLQKESAREREREMSDGKLFRATFYYLYYLTYQDER